MPPSLRNQHTRSDDAILQGYQPMLYCASACCARLGSRSVYLELRPVSPVALQPLARGSVHRRVFVFMKDGDEPIEKFPDLARRMDRTNPTSGLSQTLL